MNIKKIGLTALAGSLVATSAFAGEMSVTGSASLISLLDNSGALILVKHSQWVTS